MVRGCIFSLEEDELIWQFNSSGVYSSQSLYKIINFRGVVLVPVHVPAVWNLKIPPRVQFFLSLLSKNKLLTRDNLSIRRKAEEKTCLFCCELESVNHLFFDCVVAKQLWSVMSDIFGRSLGSDFLSIGQLWISNNKFLDCNMFSAAALWGLWKLRNKICFQGIAWKDMRLVLMNIAVTVQSWALLCPQVKKTVFL